MSKTSHKAKTTGVSEDTTHQTLLIDPTNTNNKQKSKFYLNDRFIPIFAGVITLLFIVVIILTVILSIHCYFKPNQLNRKQSNEEKLQMIDQYATSTISGNVVTIINTVNTTQVLSVMSIRKQAFARGTYVETDFVMAHED